MRIRAHAVCALILLLFAATDRVHGQETKPAAQSSPKLKIGVMKFEVGEDLKASLGTFLYNALTDEMVRSEQFTVVDWEEIDRVVKLIAKQQPNLSSQDEKRQAAMKQLGVERVYIGSVVQVGKKLSVTVKALDLNLKVCGVERGATEGEEGLDKLIIEVSAKLVLAGLAEDKKEPYAWGVACRIGTKEAYETFMKKYADSSHMAEARQALAEARRSLAAVVERTQAQAAQDRWKVVRQNMTEESLLSYLKDFPDGADATEAKKAYEQIRGARLEQEARKKKREDISGLWIWKANGYPNGEVRIVQNGKHLSITNRGCDSGYTGSYADGEFQVQITASSQAFWFRNTMVGTVSADGMSIAFTSKSEDSRGGTTEASGTMTRGGSSDVAEPQPSFRQSPPRHTTFRPTSFCFIATAAYGSAWEPNVVTLRSFRDQWLVTNAPGRWFVETYYRLSPPLAAGIAERSWARFVTRVILTPIVIVAGATLGQPVDISIVVCVILLVHRWRSYRRRASNPSALLKGMA